MSKANLYLHAPTADNNNKWVPATAADLGGNGGTANSDPTTGTTQTAIADLLGQVPAVDADNPDIRGYLKLISDRLQFTSGDGIQGSIQPKPATETASDALAANPNRIGFVLTSLQPHNTTNAAEDLTKRILIAFGEEATAVSYSAIAYPGYVIKPDTLAEARGRISVITESGSGTINYTIQEILSS